MKIKHLVIVGLILAILTIGAVSASDDITADDLAASDEGEVDVVDTPVDEVQTDEVLSTDAYDEDGFDGYVEEDAVDVNSDETVVSINTPDEGNFTISVSSEGSLSYDVVHEVNDEDRECESVDWTLADLGITQPGIYMLSAKFTFPSGDEESIFSNCMLNVTGEGTGEGPGEGPEFNVNIINDFDAFDPDLVILTVTSTEPVTGTIWVEVNDDDERENKVYSRQVDNEDNVQFTVSDLGLTGFCEEAEFWVYYSAEGEEPDWTDDDRFDSSLDELWAGGRNYSDFWWVVMHNTNYYDNNPIVYLYCPDGAQGAAVISVYRYTDKGEKFVKNSSKEINNENDLYWFADELGLEPGEGYGIYINCSGFEDGAEFFLESPIYFNDVSYIGIDDDERVGIVTIEIPSDMDADIILIINGTRIELDTDSFVERDDETGLDDLYWEYPWGRGEALASYKINNVNLDDFEFNEGVYNIKVTIKPDEGAQFTQQANVTVAKPKSKEKGNYSITIYDADSYFVREDEWVLAELIAPEDANGTLIVTVSGEEIFDMDLEDFKDGYVILPRDLGLSEGTFEITVAYWEDGEQILNNTALVSFDYGDDGIMWSHVPYVMVYGYDYIRLFFPKEVEGEVCIIIDDVEYYRNFINEDSLEYDDEEGAYVFHVSLEDFNQTIESGDYNVVAIIYNGTDGINDYDWHKDLSVVPNHPMIYIPDWPVSIQDGDVVLIYPNNDESENIRIVLTIDGEVYLNSTIEELGLYFQMDDEHKHYYGIPVDMLDMPIFIGEIYDNVIAYYYSDNYNITSADDEEANTQLIVEGMLSEVEYNYTGPVISVYCEKDDGMILVYIEGSDMNMAYPIKEGDKDSFISFSLDQLGLELGYEGFIELQYSDEEDAIFGGNIRVVNNSDFRGRSVWETLTIFENYVAVEIYCPPGSVGQTLRIYSNQGDLLCEHVIQENDQGAYVGFTPYDMGLSEPGWYELNATVDGKQLGNNFGFNIRSVIELIQNGIATLPEEGDDEEIDSMLVAHLNLPHYFEGNVVITFDGVTVFDEDLALITGDDWGPFVHYDIFTSDLDDIEEGTYEISVSFGDFCEEGTITIAKRNLASRDNVTIEMLPLEFTYDDHYTADYWDTYFAVVTVLGIDPDEWMDVDISVVLNGEDYPITIDGYTWVNEIWDDDNVVGYSYYLRAGDIKNQGEYSNLWGNFNVTVIYYDENSDEFLRNNGTLVINRMPSVIVCFTGDWDERIAEYYVGDDIDVVHIHYFDDGLNPDEFRLVLFANNTVLLDDVLANLNYTTGITELGNPYVQVKVDNLKDIAYGHYDDVYAVLFMEDYNTTSYDNGCDSFDIYGPSSVDFSNYVVFVQGGNGNTTMTLIGATVSEDNITVDGQPDVAISLNDNVITVSNLAVGNYTLRVITTPISEYYFSVEETLNVYVSEDKIDPDFNITIENVAEGSPIKVRIDANPLFTGDVYLNVGSNRILVSVKNGKGVNEDTGVILPAGEYDVTLNYGTTETYNKASAKTSFNVISTNPVDNNNASGNGANPSQGGNSAQTPATAPGQGQTQAPAAETVKLVVKKVKVKKSAKKLVLKATLTINGKKVKGKIIKFKFNGKTYKAKTNKKGIAKVTIKKKVLKKLKVGKKIKYQVSYGKTVKKMTLKVKK